MLAHVGADGMLACCIENLLGGVHGVKILLKKTRCKFPVGSLMLWEVSMLLKIILYVNINVLGHPQSL